MEKSWSLRSMHARLRCMHARGQAWTIFRRPQSERIMMSTHCSLLIGRGLSKATPMTSAFVSALIFSAGLISGYALRAWRVQRSPANSSRGASRRTAGPTPTTTFGHARRAF